MAHQLNVFVENKPGQVKSVAEVLQKTKVNIIGFTIQDKGQFGFIKILVTEPEQANLALAGEGFASALKEVLVIGVKDEIGNLHRLTSVLFEHKVNLVDSYGFVVPGRKVVCVVELNSISGIDEILKKEGFEILSDADLAGLL